MTNPQNPSSSSAALAGGKLRFGAFEVDFDQRELRNRGVRINLQKKPFQILELLLQKPGALVTREELAHHLWPGLHVSFARGLNTAVNTLRQALGDSLSASRYIETRSGLGYRFIAPVEEVRGAASSSAASAPAAHQQNRAARSDAHQDYLRGRYLQHKMTESDLGKSLAHFESAISQDPSFALAYAGMADTYSLFAVFGLLAPAIASIRATELTMRALRLDNQLAEAHASLGRVKSLFDRDYSAASEAYARALELNSDYREGRCCYGVFLSAMGRPAEALPQLRLAYESDPLSLIINAEIAWTHYIARNFGECIRQSWQTLVLEADFAPAQHTLGLAYEQMSMYDEALTELHNAHACSPGDLRVMAALGHACARSGRREEALEIMQELAELSRKRYVSSYWRSLPSLGLGQNERALDLLEQACDERDPWLLWLNTEPRFDPIRLERRFQRLLANAGF